MQEVREVAGHMHGDQEEGRKVGWHTTDHRQREEAEVRNLRKGEERELREEL